MTPKFKCPACERTLSTRPGKPCQFCVPILRRQNKLKNSGDAKNYLRVMFMHDHKLKPHENAIEDSAGNWFLEIKSLKQIKDLMKCTECDIMFKKDGKSYIIILFKG